MPLTFDMKMEYGRMTIRQHSREGEPRDYELKIVHGNCLAVWIFETEEEYHLFFFLNDKSHGRRIIKNTPDHTLLGKWGEDVVYIELNMYYKESKDLLDLFMASGYEVKCYYEKTK